MARKVKKKESGVPFGQQDSWPEGQTTDEQKYWWNGGHEMLKNHQKTLCNLNDGQMQL